MIASGLPTRMPDPRTRSLVTRWLILARRAGRLALLAVAALTAGALGAKPVHAGPVVTVLLSEPSGIYQAAADSLKRELAGGPGDWKLTVTTSDRYAASGSHLTVAIGTRALEKALAAPARPVLSLLVPRLTYERLAAGQTQVTALYLDQPLPRQLQLLGIVVPGLKRVGAPLGPSSKGLQPLLQRAARDTGIAVGSVAIERGAELYAALNDLAEDSQAFVLLPDSVVAQRNTLQNFFLHTYRLKKPVLAYSEPLAQSGALVSLYATPEQLGEEAAQWIRESWIQDRIQLGAPRYPQRFTVSVNRTVARSLEIAVPGEAMLALQLGATQ